MPSETQLASKNFTPAGAEEYWATVEGHRVRYLRAGSGPPLLLVHGLLGYSFSWRFNLEPLGRVRTCYAPDLTGIGYSERYPCDFSQRASAARLLAFLDELDISDCDVLGTSHGGGMAMCMAAQAIERGRPRTRRMILAAPVNPWSPITNPLVPLLRTRFGRHCFAGLGPRTPFLHGYVLRRLYGDRGRIPPGTLEGYAAPLKLPRTTEYIYGILDCWEGDMKEIEGALERIRDIPTLLIWGERDLAVKPSSAEPLRRRFDRAELVMLPGVGHLPYEEAPEEFNRIVTDTLARPA